MALFAYLTLSSNFRELIMRKPILSVSQRKEICEKYTRLFMTQSDLAAIYAVSRRTIFRTLTEAGVLMSPVTFKKNKNKYDSKMQLELSFV